MRSMTGFGERRCTARGFRARIGIRSLNHRYFDWSYKGAPLGELENRLRVLAQRKLFRGRVEAAVDLDFLDPSSWEMAVNVALLEKILMTMDRVSKRLGRPLSLASDSIFRIPQVVEIRRKELTPEMRTFLEKAFDETIDQVLRERRREGREIGRQIRRHIQSMKRSLRRIESLAGKQPRLIRGRLVKRLTELNEDVAVEEERIAGEAAFLVQKADIAEEIMRLRSHLSAFELRMGAGKDEPVGKMLDFLSQEIFREANTINSKSQNIAITKESLIIKSEIETIRQHIQNIE
ncbi:MAG: YicC family protein [Candidatus Aminicenantes bacterium]|nr:YicC family protein [Candidatus Aminicenantes bacterium]